MQFTVDGETRGTLEAQVFADKGVRTFAAPGGVIGVYYAGPIIMSAWVVNTRLTDGERTWSPYLCQTKVRVLSRQRGTACPLHSHSPVTVMVDRKCRVSPTRRGPGSASHLRHTIRGIIIGQEALPTYMISIGLSK